MTWSVLGVPWHGAWHGWLVGGPWPRWAGSQAPEFGRKKAASHKSSPLLLAQVPVPRAGLGVIPVHGEPSLPPAQSEICAQPHAGRPTLGSARTDLPFLTETGPPVSCGARQLAFGMQAPRATLVSQDRLTLCPVPQLSDLKQHKSIFLRSGGQRSDAGLTGWLRLEAPGDPVAFSSP